MPDAREAESEERWCHGCNEHDDPWSASPWRFLLRDSSLWSADHAVGASEGTSGARREETEGQIIPQEYSIREVWRKRWKNFLRKDLLEESELHNEGSWRKIFQVFLQNGPALRNEGKLDELNRQKKVRTSATGRDWIRTQHWQQSATLSKTKTVFLFLLKKVWKKCQKRVVKSQETQNMLVLC